MGLASLLVCELAFGFVPRSHGYTSLARINWHVYFQRQNELGFRDTVEHDCQANGCVL